MSRWEHRYLGQERFPDALSAMEIEHFFTLGEEYALSSLRWSNGSIYASTRSTSVSARLGSAH